MAPLSVDREEKKVNIAHAAVRVFARHGYGGTKMVDIASEAGVGKGTIYEYFRSKDEVFGFAIERFMLSMSRRLAEKMYLLTDPFERLEALIDGSIEMLKEAGDEAHFLFEVWAEGLRSGKELIDLKSIYGLYRESIGALLLEGMREKAFRPHDPDLVASIIIGALDGLALQWASDPDAIPLDQTADELYEMLRKGLSPK